MNNEEYRRYESNDTVDNVKHSNLQRNDYAYKETYDTMRMPTANERVRPINCDDGMSVYKFSGLTALYKRVSCKISRFCRGSAFCGES